MLEWLKRHAWKACKLQKGFGGSNPPLSARLLRTIESELAQVRLRVKVLQGCRRQTWAFEVGERSEVGVLESYLSRGSLWGLRRDPPLLKKVCKKEKQIN